MPPNVSTNVSQPKTVSVSKQGLPEFLRKNPKALTSAVKFLAAEGIKNKDVFGDQEIATKMQYMYSMLNLGREIPVNDMSYLEKVFTTPKIQDMLWAKLEQKYDNKQSNKDEDE